MQENQTVTNNTFRPFWINRFPKTWILSIVLYGIHALIRFGGLWNPLLIPLSMIIIWPLPWILSDQEGRRKIGFRPPKSRDWLIYGPVLSIFALVFCVILAWGVFSTSQNNWLVQHALMLKESLASIPEGASLQTKFWIVTIPAMIFSPLGEEFLYRGFILKSVEAEWNYKTAMIVQASVFALAHLAHYGLLPFQPLLILIWLPSMFLTALVLGWIVKKSGSIWIGVLSHMFFNFGMNAVVFLMLPN